MLITEEYREQQQKLHAKGNYGVTASKYGAIVSALIDKNEVDHLLDYGCGSNLSLRETLKPQRPFQYQAYDPCVPDYAGDPEPAEMTVCVDVLEHIQKEFLDDVLDHIMDLTDLVLFCTINTGPAGKTLEDGRNAHLIQQPMEWWLPKIWERFTIQTFQITGQNEFMVIANNLNIDIEMGKQSIISSAVIKS